MKYFYPNYAKQSVSSLKRSGLTLFATCLMLMTALFLSGCEKDDQDNSIEDKTLTCGSTLPAGFQCISSGGKSVVTTYKMPEVIGYWDESLSDFCVQYKSDGTGIITYKASGFTKGSTQNIKWGAMVNSKGDLQLSTSGTVYICHESLQGSIDPQIAILSFKTSTGQWYGYDLKKVASCGTTGSGGGTGSGGNGQIVFWTDSDLGCGTISVQINGKSGSIDSHYGSSPACGASGCANFSLPAGNYSYTATCDGFKWGPTSVTVTSGECFKMKLR